MTQILFEETKKALTIMDSKVSESRMKNGRYPFNDKIVDLRKLIDNAASVDEQEFYERKIKQVKIDEKFIAPYYPLVPVEEKSKVSSNYQIERDGALKTLNNELASYKKQSEGIDFPKMKESLITLYRVYEVLGYAREIEYRLDVEKYIDRKEYLDVRKSRPYDGRLHAIRKFIKQTKDYEKTAQEFKQIIGGKQND